MTALPQPYRFPLLVALGAVSLLALWQTRALRTTADVRSMLPDRDAQYAEYEAFAGRFGSDRVVALVLGRPGGFFEPEALEALSALCDELAAIPWVRRVESITHTTSVASQAGVIEARPLFVEPPFDDAQAERGRRELLGSPVFARHLVSANGGTVAVMAFLEERTVAREVLRALPDVVAGDPVAYGEAGAALHTTINDAGMALARGELEGDPDAVRLAAVRELAGSGIDGGVTLAARIDRLAADAEQALLDYDTEAVETLTALLEEAGGSLAKTRGLIGPPILRVGLMERVAIDVQQAVIGALVLLLLIAWVGLREPLRVPLPMGVAVIGALWTLAVASLLGVEFDLVAVAAMFPVVALSLTCATLLCLEDRPRLRPALAVLGSGAFLAAIGASMWVSDVEAVRRFGTVLSCGGLLGALAPVALVSVVLASNESRLPTAPRRPRRRWVVLAAVFAGLSSAFGLARLSLGVDYPANLLPRDPLAQTYTMVDQQLSGLDAFRLQLTASEVDRLKDPDVLAAVAQLQRRLEALDGVDATLSYVDVVSSIYAALDPDHAGELPDRRNLVEQLLLLFGSPDALAPFVHEDYDQAAITVRGTVGGGKPLRALVADAEAAAAEVLPDDVRCTPQGELLLTSRAADLTARRLWEGAARGLVLALAVMMIAIRRVRPFLRLALPVALLTVASVGAAALASPMLGPMTSTIPWIGLAVGTPVALVRARAGRPGPRDWLAVAVVGAAFAPLLASTLRFDAAVGLGVALGAAVGAIYLWGDGGVEID